MIAATALLVPARIAGQGVPGMRVTWSDLQTWSRPVEGAGEVLHGLGLQVSGSGGTMFLGFEGRIALRQPRPPQSVNVMAGAPFTSNPNSIRPAVLTLAVVDVKKDKHVIELTDRMTVDNPAPGAMVENGVATMRAADFIEVISAESATANVFGINVTIRPDQLKAIRALGDRLQLKPKEEKKESGDVR